MGIYYGLRELAISPEYTLGFELNSWFQIQLKFNYFIPIDKKEGLYFLEEDGFFRNNAYLRQSYASSLKSATHPMSFSVGLRFGL